MYAPPRKEIYNMLTRNFWKILGAVLGKLYGGTYYVDMALPDGTTVSYDLQSTGAKPYSVLGAIADPYATSDYATNKAGTWYGTGRTPATLDDVKLEAPITDGSISITCGTNLALLKTESSDHYRFSATHQITNNTAQEIALSEIGCFGIMSASTSAKACLLDRTVLETPIVIPAKETVSVEYVIKFPYEL